jgi:hypothetical protein
MNILKNQNSLLTKEHAREKEQVRLALEALASENRQLKDALIEAHFKIRKMKRSHSKEARLGDYICEQFDSCRDHEKLQSDGREVGRWESERERGLPVGDTEDSNVSKSSIAAMLRHTSSQPFKESRMTRIKGRGGYEFQEGLERMSTRTQLSRQRSSRAQ